MVATQWIHKLSSNRFPMLIHKLPLRNVEFGVSYANSGPRISGSNFFSEAVSSHLCVTHVDTISLKPVKL